MDLCEKLLSAIEQDNVKNGKVGDLSHTCSQLMTPHEYIDNLPADTSDPYLPKIELFEDQRNQHSPADSVPPSMPVIDDLDLPGKILTPDSSSKFFWKNDMDGSPRIERWNR